MFPRLDESAFIFVAATSCVEKRNLDKNGWGNLRMFIDPLVIPIMPWDVWGWHRTGCSGGCQLEVQHPRGQLGSQQDVGCPLIKTLVALQKSRFSFKGYLKKPQVPHGKTMGFRPSIYGS